MLDRLTERRVPHNIEAEQALLGAILIDNAAIDRLGSLAPSDFYEALHAHLFAIATAMRGEGTPITPVTLAQHVAEWPSIADNLSARQYVARMMVEAPSIQSAPAYAETIREQAARRQLMGLADDLVVASLNAEATVSQIASSAVSALDHVLSISRPNGRKAVPLGQAMADVLDMVSNDDGRSRIPTGMTDLDKALSGGWRRKQYAIIAGRPSMGKTTIATSAMLRTARAGHGVMFLSLEMPTEQVAARALTDLAYTSTQRIAYNALISNNVNEHQFRMIMDASRQFRQLPLVIDDERGLTIAEIGARIRAQQQRFHKAGIDLGLVVIDHLGFIRASERYRGNRVHEVTEISAGLGQIAKDLDIALVVLSQLNRGTEGRENKRPTLADLRDSGSLEQDADVVIFTFREAYYLERMRCDEGSQQELQRQTELEACRNTMELLVSKNRNGPTTTVPLYCDMGSNAVRDLG